MPTIIASFGYRHGVPARERDSLTIDVRPLFGRNPWHDKRLRVLRGDDPRVEADILKTPSFDQKYATLRKMVADWDGPVYLGCTGGHHRSVYLAGRLARELGCGVAHINYHDK